MNKNEIRKKIIEIRDGFDVVKKGEADLKIKKSLENQSFFSNCKNIFIYIGFGSEIDTKKYIEEFLKLGKNVLVPRIDMKIGLMECVKINSLSDLKVGNYDILEPIDEIKAVDKKIIDLVIMPGVAFDITGGRIGYGGGYYDKFLEDIQNDVLKVALAYDFQVFEKLEIEEHDIKADMVITEKQVRSNLKCKM